jgi:hypothetical protein
MNKPIFTFCKENAILLRLIDIIETRWFIPVHMHPLLSRQSEFLFAFNVSELFIGATMG